MGQQQIDEAGRCALHPGIQLHHQKKNGEWRILLNACPLCVSGLPATGQPISTPASRALATPLDHGVDVEVEVEREVVAVGSREEKKKKRKDKKKKHRSSRPREGGGSYDMDEEEEGAAEENHHRHGGDNNQQQQQHQLTHPPSSPPRNLMEDIEREMMLQKKKKKSRSRSGSGGRGRSGSGGRRRDSSATPPAARPRSPSPQTPRSEANQNRGQGQGQGQGDDREHEHEYKHEHAAENHYHQQQQNQHQQQQLGENDNDNDNDNEGWNNQKMAQDYNAFLEFMGGDYALEQHQQQQQQQTQDQALQQQQQQRQQVQQQQVQQQQQQQVQQQHWQAEELDLDARFSQHTIGESVREEQQQQARGSFERDAAQQQTQDQVVLQQQQQKQGQQQQHQQHWQAEEEQQQQARGVGGFERDARSGSQAFCGVIPQQRPQQQHDIAQQQQHVTAKNTVADQNQNSSQYFSAPVDSRSIDSRSIDSRSIDSRSIDRSARSDYSHDYNSAAETVSNVDSVSQGRASSFDDDDDTEYASEDYDADQNPPHHHPPPPDDQHQVLLPNNNSMNAAAAQSYSPGSRGTDSHGRDHDHVASLQDAATPRRGTANQTSGRRTHQRPRSKSPYQSPYRATRGTSVPPAASQVPEEDDSRQGAEPRSRRPDPEDANEFKHHNIITNHQGNTNAMYDNKFGQKNYQAQAHPPPPPPVLSPIQSPPKIPRGGYLAQHQQQQQQQQQHDLYPNSSHDSETTPKDDNNANNTKVLEQDDVSIISMSSVTRNMYKNQAAQLLLQQQKQLQEVVTVEDDQDSASHSNRSSSNDNDNNEEDQSTSHSSNNPGVGSDNILFNTGTSGEINTCDYDDRGRCRRHPTVKLRKKQFMRKWKVVLSNCPECCLDEMRRVKDERIKSRHRQKMRSEEGSRAGSKGEGSKGSRGKSSKGEGSSSRSKKSKKKKKSKNPPIAQLNYRSAGGNGNDNSNGEAEGEGGGDEYDDTRSIGTASTITISSYTHSTGGGRTWQNYANDGSSVASGRSTGSGRSAGSGRSTGSNGNQSTGSNGDNNNDNNSQGSGSPPVIAKVTRMPYTDAYGENGWYTGQVDSTTGTPHGLGTMNYSNGAVYEGQWKNGVSMTPSKTREEPTSFGPAKIVPRGNHHHHHRQMHHHSAFGRGTHHHHQPPSAGRSYLATLNEDGSSSDYEYASSRQGMARVGSASGLASLDGASQSSFDSQQQQPQRTVVCGMRWTNHAGDAGTYTGEVNEINAPDGMGTMRYDDGIVAEGMWANGELNVGDSAGSEKEDCGDRITSSGSLLQQQQGTLYGLASMGGGGGYSHRGGAASVH